MNENGIINIKKIWETKEQDHKLTCTHSFKEKKFRVETDVSEHVIGGVLF